MLLRILWIFCYTFFSLCMSKSKNCLHYDLYSFVVHVCFIIFVFLTKTSFARVKRTACTKMKTIARLISIVRMKSLTNTPARMELCLMLKQNTVIGKQMLTATMRWTIVCLVRCECLSSGGVNGYVTCCRLLSGSVNLMYESLCFSSDLTY